MIEEKEVPFLIDVKSYYKRRICELGGEEFQDVLPKVQKLEDKLKKHFGEDICIEKGNTRKGP